jgi:ubiquinone/menaquinone biosynthesis C-methylase UbiE
MTSPADYVAANRETWNEVAPRHAAHNQQRLKELFATGGYNNLEDEYIAMLERIGVAGRSVVQVCCNNGIDLLSAKGMGAGECLGIDQAAAFLEQARELASVAGHGDVRFMEANAYELPGELAGRFDIAMTTIGVTGWMPDIKAFFRSVAGLVRPGGHWVMEEMHPVLMMYEPDPNGGPSRVQHSYFRTEPFVETAGLDYFGHEAYDSAPNYSFTHTLSDLVNAGVEAGLELAFMDEVGRDISNFCSDLETAEARPPLGLYMLWRKRG